MAAYAIIFILTMIIISGSGYIVGSYMMNELISFMNNMAGNGMLFNYFVSYWQFIIAVWTVLPLLLLLAYAIWGIVRGLERRNEYIE